MFQAFACEDFDEIGKSYLRADFRIECDTPKHKAFKIYAAVMICICESSRANLLYGLHRLWLPRLGDVRPGSNRSVCLMHLGVFPG